MMVLLVSMVGCDQLICFLLLLGKLLLDLLIPGQPSLGQFNLAYASYAPLSEACSLADMGMTRGCMSHCEAGATICIMK